MLKICEKPNQKSTFTKCICAKIGGTIWVRYSLENILAGPVVKLVTMYNIRFGVISTVGALVVVPD